MHGPIYLAEKTAAGLPTLEQTPLRPTKSLRSRLVTVLCFFLVVISLFHLVPALFELIDDATSKPTTNACAQVAPLRPAVISDKLKEMEDAFDTKEYRELSAQRLSGAVQIKTQSFDNLGPIGEDERWDAMYPFAEYLAKTYPLVHSKLQLEKVNTHGLLYTWNGTDSSLKPTLLMAHQDTVPVPDATIDQWTHPPWSGFIDKENGYIWGRGAADCKNQLTAVLDAVEGLLAAEFVPRRTLLLSFGFDEEISGRQGAGHLSKHMLERYGEDSIAVIVDEGMGISTDWGVALAQPGVAEKGYTDVHINLRMPGGHSSIPPDHTAIGVMSELITNIEADQYETFLDAKNPYLAKLQCGAEYGKDFPKKIRKLLPKAAEELKKKHKGKGDELAKEVAKAGGFVRYLMQTSIAVDIIAGGVKVNALPERVSATVNHRINIGEVPDNVHEKVTTLSKDIAKKYNLTLNAFNDANETARSLNLEAGREKLVPAPVTPTSIDGVTPYGILSGTTRALYGEELIVSPGLMTGNTDTRYMWKLSRHIFRWGPSWTPGDEGSIARSGIHTVDERMSITAHINGAKWFSLFIRSVDESEL